MTQQNRIELAWIHRLCIQESLGLNILMASHSSSHQLHINQPMMMTHQQEKIDVIMSHENLTSRLVEAIDFVRPPYTGYPQNIGEKQ